MGLLITSKQASDAGVSGPLMDLLLEHGAAARSEEAGRPGCAAGQPCAARRGKDDRARRETGSSRRRGTGPNGPAARGVRRRREDCGRRRAAAGKTMTRARRHRAGVALRLRPRATRRRGFSPREGRQLEHDRRQQRHGAASRRVGGDLAMVKRLVAKGADVSDRNNPFNATPLSWADHDKQTEVFQWMQAALRHRSARCGLLRSAGSCRGSTSRRSRVGQQVHRSLEDSAEHAAALGRGAESRRNGEAPPGERRRSEHPGRQRAHCTRCRRAGSGGRRL